MLANVNPFRFSRIGRKAPDPADARADVNAPSRVFQAFFKRIAEMEGEDCAPAPERKARVRRLDARPAP